MLATLLIWAYSFTIFYIYGFGGLILLKKIFHLQDGIALSFPIIAIMGAAVLTTFASFLSLIMPLGGGAAILILLGGVLIAIATRPWKNFSIPAYHFLVVILLVIVTYTILENATHKPTDYDTALYHAQAIHWIESYRAVPGLVNIHDRLAYNSSWLVLVASLSFAFLGLRSFHLTNSVILLVTMIYFGEGFQGLIQKQVTISNIVKVILFFLPLYLYASDLSSPGTDLPPVLLTWVITVLILEKVEKRGFDFDLYSIVIFTLSIFTVTVKLSTLPFFGLVLLILTQQIWNKDWRRSVILVGTAFFILLPWFMRNIVLSGYLIFPIPQINLFSFDWKYPLNAAIQTRDGLLWFNRFPVNTKEYVGMSTVQWLPLWFHQLARSQKILFLLALVSPMGLFAYIFSRATRKLANGYIIAFLINYIGVFFWLFTAPILRFGYAYLLASTILASTLMILSFNTSIGNSSSIFSFPLIIFALLFQLFILTTTTNLSTLSQRALLPADYYPSNVLPCPIDNSTFYCAQKLGLCDYEAFPCIPKHRDNVELRGLTLQDGFRTINTP
ncbi:MAG: hypothetical protein WBW94_07650 [Anaerolineales bacterium]